MRRTLVLALSLAAACTTSPPRDDVASSRAPAVDAAFADTPAPAELDPAAPESPYTAFAKGPWKPLTSADGRWTMSIVALNTDAISMPTGDRFVGASVRFSPDSGDALVVAPPVLRLATSVGEAPRTDPKWSRIWFAGKSVALHAPIPPAIDRLGFAELSCKLMRVAEWRTTEVVLAREGLMPAIASPFRLRCSPDATWVWVAASLDEDSLRAQDAKELAHMLGHAWASNAAEITDANGAKLTAGGGSGSGGGTSTMYFVDGGNGTIAVDYPVTVRLRVPARYAVEDVVFRLDGLPLPRHAPSH